MRIGRASAILLCLVAGLLAAAAGSDSAPPRQDAEPRVIEVQAQRFTFEPSQIEAEEGERLRIVVRSADGMHGFEIKKFKVSQEVPRGGEPAIIDFTPDETGRFPILCSLFCGDGHEDMKGMLIVTARAVARR